MYTVYVLRSLKDGNLYIGCTGDITQRLAYHNVGKVASTKYRLPFEHIYSEKFDNKKIAFRTEKFYKTARGKKLLKQKMKNCGIV